ncbi:MAG TPA: alpha-amylase family glycosyl hydrolase, partial [Spirochaetia bacterium]|nr:alpha-amylase family glycosyl hydrolase [Spirochaetia bacterium]
MSTARHFHVSRAARERYGLSKDLFSPGGGSVFPDLHAARRFTQKLNDARRAAGLPEDTALRPGDANAMALIDEVLHLVIELYGRQAPDAFSRALAYAQDQLGEEAVRSTLERYLSEFPPFAPPPPDAPIGLEELLMLFLANANLAFDPFSDLFDDQPLAATSYSSLLEALTAFFHQEPAFGPDDQDLVSMLRSPAVAAPTSLQGQLEYIRTRWGYLLGDLLLRLLTGLDLLKEERKQRFGPFTPGPPGIYEYAGQTAEVEAFSEDREWMPRAVMMARNALVWLDQLSRRYSREIRRLDQVPDEELDRLAQAGFTALWLIGVWERSAASREIKRRMGNQEAEASAYSLYDYVIAAELGGPASLENLKARAGQRGIRLASDMVPNHTGLDSRWMAEHPERFLSWPHEWPPFPSYSFSGPNLSQVPGLGVYLEDRYWNKSDAAVVFKRVDFGSGHSRLIYHGNDGTHMPWNDTSQLDFLNPETREAVIQTILHVARMFPVIRFDAAMTLTKKHIQRLWYPEPGSGGDIPSRAGNGMSRRDFDKAMPVEFWREVVDRVAREAPDTLLLAEAFWMLEGFFVRTLGMHRVYNSAFMHMLKDEDNAGYRHSMKNTLEFDPEVLKRFVNFMSNPDEQTAIEQFGDGDKYIGVCTLMCTLPGLPMFAHGQVEGLREKYG